MRSSKADHISYKLVEGKAKLVATVVVIFVGRVLRAIFGDEGACDVRLADTCQIPEQGVIDVLSPGFVQLGEVGVVGDGLFRRRIQQELVMGCE